MALHLLKLAVGCDTLDDLEARIADRLADCRAAKRPLEHAHQTRMVPKRVAELLDGGSLFWVVRGKVMGRQALLDIRPFTDADGIARCQLVLDPLVHPVMPRSYRPFQGWRYLAEEDRPVDLEGAVPSDMPHHLASMLRELCLI